MKKLMFILLALILVTSSVLVACSDSDESSGESSKAVSSSDSSSEESSKAAESSSASAASSEESSEESVEESSEEPVDVFTEEIDKTTDRKFVSKEKTYSSDNEPQGTYLDPDMKKLTDGEFGNEDPENPKNVYTDPIWVGYNSNSNPPYEIIINLGEIVSGIAEFEASILKDDGPTIKVPLTVHVEISSDNTTWVKAGDLEFGDTSASPSICVAELKSDKGCSAQYVKFSFTGENWTFISELAVYAYGE